MILTLSLRNPLHLAVWKAMQKIPKGKRTEYICRKILEKNEAELSAMVYESVKKALAECGNISVQAKEQQIIQKSSDKADEVEKNFFGFLSTLQVKGDGKR